MIIWLTGLPCSGKTTIAHALKTALTHDGLMPEHLVEILDGDDLRATPFANKAGFTPEERHEHLLRVGYLAQRLSKHAAYVICAFVSPHELTRRMLPADVTVYVRCPPTICESRDVKGMWAQARAGKIERFTGVDSIYEPPDNPDVTVDSSWMTLNQCVTMIMEVIRGKRAAMALRPT